MSKEYYEGYKACINEKFRNVCPYKSGTIEFDDWHYGYSVADDDD